MEEEKSNSSSVGEGRGSEASKRAAKMSRLAELSKASAREATRASEAATIAADALQMEAGRIIEAGEAPEAAVIQALEIARLQSRQLSAVAEAAATPAPRR